MFVIRQAQLDDLQTLLKLARLVHSNNLPADPDILHTKLLRSRDSFAGKSMPPHNREFMFALEDIETGNVIGTSAIISRISSPGRPHLYFLVRKREHFSEDLATGQVHVTLQLGLDETGPSEIGGLVLTPAYRGHKGKLGALLSLIRFNYIGVHREFFSDRIIAEMAAPITPDSRNTLWEYLGRRFINLEYAEADRFCRQSKEFVTSLFPRGEIYASLLPPEARHLIGRVSPDAEPAKAMLEHLGFEYQGHCDPFDGGPYLEASISQISLVQSTRTAKLAEPSAGSYPGEGFASFEGPNGFRGVRTPLLIANDGATISIPARQMELLQAKVGQTIAVTPRKASAATNTQTNQPAEMPVQGSQS